MGAFASPVAFTFEQFKEREAKQKEYDEINARWEEQTFTDSLLNAIEIDPLTRNVYTRYTPSLDAPLIMEGFPEETGYNVEIKAPSFTGLVGVVYEENDSVSSVIYPAPTPELLGDPVSQLIRKNVRFQNQIRQANLQAMIDNPSLIKYTEWGLPVPPKIYGPDFSFRGYLRHLELPSVEDAVVVMPEVEIKRRNWLHTFNVSLQLSQAYVSPNWYQGGNSNVSGLFNFGWNVDLNPNYYPKLLFQSALTYKLAVNANPKGSLHKYNIAQDLFQYNLKTGLKAFNHWFYTLNLLFNTQLFNAYPDDSMQRTSSLLSPGTLNIGVGMTYTLQKKRLNLTASISPLAYNLKTCIYSDIDHEQFNIRQNRKSVSEIGSSGEINLTWNFTDNVSWKSRLFLFTDYSYFLADWENTFNFQFNRFLSAQIYLHPRWDTSAENSAKWHRFMLHEILSFGISYTFSTPR